MSNDDDTSDVSRFSSQSDTGHILRIKFCLLVFHHPAVQYLCRIKRPLGYGPIPWSISCDRRITRIASSFCFDAYPYRNVVSTIPRCALVSRGIEYAAYPFPCSESDLSYPQICLSLSSCRRPEAMSSGSVLRNVHHLRTGGCRRGYSLFLGTSWLDFGARCIPASRQHRFSLCAPDHNFRKKAAIKSIYPERGGNSAFW